jgi:hypothetical protein
MLDHGGWLGSAGVFLEGIVPITAPMSRGLGGRLGRIGLRHRQGNRHFATRVRLVRLVLGRVAFGLNRPGRCCRDRRHGRRGLRGDFGRRLGGNWSCSGSLDGWWRQRNDPRNLRGSSQRRALGNGLGQVRLHEAGSQFRHLFHHGLHSLIDVGIQLRARGQAHRKHRERPGDDGAPLAYGLDRRLGHRGGRHARIEVRLRRGEIRVRGRPSAVGRLRCCGA